MMIETYSNNYFFKGKGVKKIDYSSNTTKYYQKTKLKSLSKN